jgi:hypothetical protein
MDPYSIRELQSVGIADLLKHLKTTTYRVIELLG